MLYIRKSKSGFGLKKALSILLVLCIVFLQMVFVNAWQSDNGNGTFTNPVLYADYPDPSIIRVGSDFYFASTTFAGSPGLVILHSQDLVNWEIVSHCISSFPTGGAYDMIGGLKYANGCFAPGLAYYNGTFYVAVTLNGEATRIYHATSASGPWTYNQLSGGYFDPCLYFDNGTPYLIWGGAWENSIKIIQLNSTLSGTTGSQSTILSYNGVEGSHLAKYGGYYYLFNAVPGSLSMACSRSTTLKGPYSGTNILCSDSKGGHQGGIVDMPDGSYWYYLMKDSGGIGRMTYFAPVTWSNSWPLVGRSGYTGTIESSYTKPIANKPIMVPATSDEFNGSTLGLQWMWNHNPDNSKWSFTGSALRLKATTGSDFWHARNSLTQKGQGLTSSGSIRIDCSAIQNGDIGGLGMLGDPRGYIAVTKDSSGKKIIMSEEDSVKATVSNITANILYFRVEMDFNTKLAKFFWKDDSSNWQQLGTTITMGFDWQNGTFQGEQYAILNFNTGSSTGYMDVDWFRFNDVPGPGGTSTPSPTPGGATSTPTPTPTPTPTSGSRSAFLQIESESYDTQSGVQTESCSEGGQDVAFIENGDYVVYNNVDFGSGATSFQGRVASANSGGNIEIRLDSATGPLVGTCSVAGTGGWQTWATSTCSVSGASGMHNLYLKFTGGSGYLFNMNWFQFTGGSTNLITNPGMETGNTTGWAVNGAGSIAVSTAQKHSGTYSLLHTGRTGTWNGPLQNLTSKVQNGKTYTCSGWVRLDNAASDSIIMTIKKVDDNGTTYANVANGTGSNSSWVQLSGNYTLNVTGTLTELSIYFEGPASGINYYIDDVSVQ